MKDNGGYEQRIHQSPASQNLFHIGDSKPLSEERRECFHRAVARLLYLATRIRPDILLAVTFLCSRVTKATNIDAVKLQRVIGYLAGTSELGKRLDFRAVGYYLITFVPIFVYYSVAFFYDCLTYFQSRPQKSTVLRPPGRLWWEQATV